MKFSKKVSTTNLHLLKDFAFMKTASIRNVTRYDYDDEYHEENELESKFSSSMSQWASADGNIFVPTSTVVKILTPGVYESKSSPNIGIFFEKIPVRTQGLLRFPDTNSNKVVTEIQNFWERESIFQEYKLIYKRGILLYGPPGSGKSCTIQLIMEDVVKRDGIVIKFTEPNLFTSGMRLLRQIQPETPVVIIMEDIDSILACYDESQILNLLDGVTDVHKMVFLATTNYPDRLGPRIVNRPSRFDKRFRIGYPCVESRKMYFEFIIANGDKEKLDLKIKELNIDLERWVADTDEMSIAHLKELFIAVVILQDKYEDAIGTLKTMREDLSDDDYASSIGFKPQKSEGYYN